MDDQVYRPCGPRPPGRARVRFSDVRPVTPDMIARVSASLEAASRATGTFRTSILAPSAPRTDRDPR